MEEGSLLADVLDSVVFVLKLIVANPQSSKDYMSATRGVVVRERGGTPFRQLFWSGNGAPANIVGHRWNANTEAFRQITSPSISLFSGPNFPQTRDLASKI